MKTAIIGILMIVLLAVVGIGAYMYGQSTGLTEAQNIRSEFFQSRTGNTAAAGGQANSAQGGTNVRSQATRPVASGTIKSLQGDVIEVTQQDGSTVLVALSGQTVIEKMVTGAASDLQVGARISVQGVQSTGQVNAQVIQISQGGQ
jgi:hypothetical protein